MGINSEGEVRQFNPISMTYSQLWSCFAQNSVMTPRKTRDRKSRPHWYNPNTRCELHDGIVGHPIEECKGYPGKDQKIINNDVLTFQGENPFVKGTPLC